MLTRTKEVILRIFAFYKDEEGQALAEYGLILGLIAVVAIAALTLLGGGVPPGPPRCSPGAPGGGEGPSPVHRQTSDLLGGTELPTQLTGPAKRLGGKGNEMLTRTKEVVLRIFAFYKDEEGQALAEYGLILGLVAVVAIAALTLLGTAISGKLGDITGAFGGGGSA